MIVCKLLLFIVGMSSTRVTASGRKEKGRARDSIEKGAGDRSASPLPQPEFASPEGPAPKRARSSAVNGSASSTPPARQSLRRAAIAAPPYAEMAGKAKRSRRN